MKPLRVTCIENMVDITLVDVKERKPLQVALALRHGTGEYACKTCGYSLRRPLQGKILCLAPEGNVRTVSRGGLCGKWEPVASRN